MTYQYAGNPQLNELINSKNNALEETINRIKQNLAFGSKNYAAAERGDVTADRILPIFIKDIKTLKYEPHDSFQEIYNLLKTYRDDPNENISCFGFVMATKLYSLRGRLSPDEPPEGYLLDLLHLFEEEAYGREKNILLRDAASNALVSVERKRHERHLKSWHLNPNWTVLQKNIEAGEKCRSDKPIKPSDLDYYVAKNLKYIVKQIEQK